MNFKAPKKYKTTSLEDSRVACTVESTDYMGRKFDRLVAIGYHSKWQWIKKKYLK